MSEDQIQTGAVQTHWSVSGTRILKYTVEMYHKGLNEHKLISAPETDALKSKANIQIKKWTERSRKEANLEEAHSRTEEAAESLKQIDNLLLNVLSIDNKVNWEKLKKKEKYPEHSPVQPIKTSQIEYPPKPEKQSARFTPVFTVFEKLLKSKREKKIQQYENKYSMAILEWENDKSKIDKLNKQSDKDFKDKTNQWKLDVIEWKKRETNFKQDQIDFNAQVNQTKESYINHNEVSIIEYCEIVLDNSEYPDFFNKNFELEYNSDNKILILEYELPAIECFPKVKEVKYIVGKKELKEIYISEPQENKMFDEAIYKITLRTMYELFQADVANAIEAISFNGWVKSINKATGKEENNCILSIQAKKNEFLEINLSNVDPKSCFKNLKGVASSRLSSLTPIRPILQISKVDKRFVASYAVANQIDDATNIAAMDWEDFEHLVRELFEKEFQVGGGEVRVTQASRDGGVDAVAFDPDPIRGGKIVIQAKRYTNTVGVAAVRDLYGTVINEGATKGILISTADYGPDAYEFAKGKPLTLLNGSNLLHLLEKHGQHAKIDLREAKKLLAEKDK